MKIFYFFNVLGNKNFIINLFLEILFVGLSLFFFEKISNTKFSKKNKLIYLLVNTILFAFGNLFENYIFSFILSVISSIVLFIVLQKTSKMFTFSYFCIESIIILNVQFVVFKLLCVILPYDSYASMIEMPVFGILSIIFSSLIGFVFYLVLKRFKFDNNYMVSIEEKSNLIVAISAVNLIINFSILYNFFEIFVQNLYYILGLDIYFYILISNIIHFCNKLYTTNKIDNLELYNTTILTMYDDTRAFKHDFHNIIQAIGGYVATNDMKGLKKYYSQISLDCQNVNNLCKLNSEFINNPAIYNILADKYYLANQLDIQLNVDIMLDLNNVNMKIYDLTRILGILLDNAIEASKECNNKNINIYFKQDNCKQVLIIENTYRDKQISVEKIFEKNYSTKPNNTGLGLWEVRKILNRNSNLNLHTLKNDNYFSQQLEIYSA